MNGSPSLPVIMPKVTDQRWSCQGCTNCCRTLVVHLAPKDRKRIDEHYSADSLGDSPYVRVGRGWALNKREDGACVFLDSLGRCKIHSAHGADAKPLACRMFPFSVRPVEQGWRAAVRFDCPSVALSKGEPLEQSRFGLTELVNDLSRRLPARDAHHPTLQRGVRATAEETDFISSRFVRWFRSGRGSMVQRLMGAVRCTAQLGEATLAEVRGARLAELLDLLIGASSVSAGTPVEVATPKQRNMFRQLVFAHTEHASMAEMRLGLLGRLGLRRRQLRNARRFRKGVGIVPQIPDLEGTVTFDAVQSVGPSTADHAQIEDLLLRYLTARLESRTVFGEGYYSWPVFGGLAALWLSVAVAGFLSRLSAAIEGRSSISPDDAIRAIGIVDRAATRVPALGTMAERARESYLRRDDGIARLIHEYTFLADIA